jgi:hypothetical protein
MNEGAKKGGSVETSGNNGGSSGNTEVKGSSGSQQPAPSACDKISPGCMKELSKGPVINTGGDSTTGSSCFALSGDALGFSKQAMVSDPADFVSKLGMSAQTAQTAQTSSAGAASSSKSATGSATGANSKAATGGANAQKATAGSGECVGDGCWG